MNATTPATVVYQLLAIDTRPLLSDYGVYQGFVIIFPRGNGTRLKPGYNFGQHHFLPAKVILRRL